MQSSTTFSYDSDNLNRVDISRKLSFHHLNLETSIHRPSYISLIQVPQIIHLGQHQDCQGSTSAPPVINTHICRAS
ncbi:hypothetical protein WAI453_001816 [Rhynchosporium graminicola]